MTIEEQLRAIALLTAENARDIAANSRDIAAQDKRREEDYARIRAIQEQNGRDLNTLARLAQQNSEDTKRMTNALEHMLETVGTHEIRIQRLEDQQ